MINERELDEIKKLLLTDGVRDTLQQYSSECDKTSDTVGHFLIYCAHHGDLGWMQKICQDNMPKYAAVMQDVFRISAISGHLPCVKFLIETNASLATSVIDPADSSNTAITLAAQKGHSDVVRYLGNLKDSDSEYITSVNANHNFGLKFAQRCCHTETVKTLAELYWARKIPMASLLESKSKKAIKDFQTDKFRNLLLLAQTENNSMAVDFSNSKTQIHLPREIASIIMKHGCFPNGLSPLDQEILGRIKEAQQKKKEDPSALTRYQSARSPMPKI